MRIRIKICGITDLDGIHAAGDAEVDAVGFVFAKSPRQVTPDRAAELANHLPALVARVAVFHYPDPLEIATVLDQFFPHVIQVEPNEAVLQAIRGKVPLLPVFHDHETLAESVNTLLVDRPASQTILVEAPGRGGQGKTPDWDRARRIASTTRMILAGGLTPQNVSDAIRHVRPYGVDVSSGVETAPGIKDPKKIVDFVRAVRDTALALASMEEE